MVGATLSEAEALLARARAESWPEERLVLSILSGVANALGQEQEKEGLELLKWLLAQFSGGLPAWQGMIGYFSGFLLLHNAVNHLRGKQWPDTIHGYLSAAHQFILCRFPDRAMDALARAEDIVERHAMEEPEIAMAVAAALVNMFLLVEQHLGPAGIRRVRRIVEFAISGLLASGRFSPERLMLLVQLVKGRRFACLRQVWPAEPHALPAALVSRLEEIHALERRLPAAQAVVSWQSSEEAQQLLSSRLDVSQRYPGATEEERLINLKMDFGQSFDSWLLSGAGEDLLPLLSCKQIQEALDERTVLVLLFHARTREELFSICAIVITHGRCGASGPPRASRRASSS
jgi:hypothetical protein